MLANKTIVVIPTYNEKLNLPRITHEILEQYQNLDIMIVDDNSPDGTGELADAIAEDNPRVQVLHRKTKEGLGPAYVQGFKLALEQNYELIAQMDADGSHRTVDLRKLLDRINTDANLGFVIGSRWVSGGKVANWPLHREILSRGANIYVKWMLGLNVADATAGFRVYRRSALQEIALEQVASQGYCFQVDMTNRAISGGATVAEVPIVFVERIQGYSKMTGNIINEALVSVTLWGLAAKKEKLLRFLKVSSK